MKDTIIYGRHPVVDAIKAGKTIDKVLFQKGVRGELEKEIRHLCRDYDIPLQYVPKVQIGKFVKGNHQGIIAFLSLVTYYELEDVLPSIYERSETPLVLILDGVTDIRNFGAIARTAECMGVHTIVIPQKKGVRINADAMKTSAGALAKLPICRVKNLQQAVEFIQLSGIQILSSNLKSKKNLQEISLTEPTAIIIGAEGTGVSSTLLKITDEHFIIPMKGTTDSLNVSVATGMILYEAVRQRNTTI